jgi:transcriptional regulator with PAS, ATPase and Fis domain
MRELESTIARVAQTDSTALIVGEMGTGKELAARQVHRISLRGDKPIVTVNCAAIPETLIESELFGYEKGAFTGATSNRLGLIEAADGGTLFLDEIGELPVAAQARLLRFIQEGEIRRIGSVSSKRVDVRLICATHRNLAELAARGEFREDLFYRIDVLRLDIPPLREREGDVIAMANWFIDRQAAKLGVPAKPLSEHSRDILAAHHWPGNVRELQNVIERGLVMSRGADLHISLPTATATQAGQPLPESGSEVTQSADEGGGELSLEDYFQRFVLQHQDAMNETELAQKLGISRKCLWERRQRFGIPRQKQKTA